MDLNILAQSAISKGHAGTAIDEAPELVSLLDRLFATAWELAGAEARLSDFADRLGGPIPECASDERVDPDQGIPGFASRMEALQSHLTSTLMDMNQTISRLERLA